MTHSDVIIGQVVTSSFKLHQEAPDIWVVTVVPVLGIEDCQGK